MNHGPHDTLPPSSERPTLDELPAVSDERPLPVIPAGQAQLYLSAALDGLVEAFVLLEETAMALARALDSQADQEAP